MLRFGDLLIRIMAASLLLMCCALASAQPVGRFGGDLVLKALPDGRTMELMQPFMYTDSTGVT